MLTAVSIKHGKDGEYHRRCGGKIECSELAICTCNFDILKIKPHESGKVEQPSCLEELQKGGLYHEAFVRQFPGSKSCGIVCNKNGSLEGELCGT